MFKYSLIFFIAILGLAANLLVADTVELNDGTKVEGTIISESEDSVTVEIQVSDSITDRRTISRSDISEITKTPADQVAWELLKDIQLPETAISASVYQPQIDQLQSFLEQFADSSYAAQARQLLDSFKAENERVQNGDYKIEGEWVAADDVAARQEEIDALLKYMEMRSIAQRSNSAGALTAFMQIDKDYSDQPAFPDAAALALNIASRLNSRLPQLKEGAERAAKEFEVGLARTPEQDRARVKAVYDAKQQAYNEALERVRRNREEFPPLFQDSERSVRDVEQALRQLLRKLKSLDVDAMKESLKLTKSANQQIVDGDFDEARKTLDEAKNLWTRNAQVASLNKQLQTAVREAEVAAREAEKLAAQQAKEAAAAAVAQAEITEQTEAAQKAKKSDADDAGAPFDFTSPMGAGIIVGVLVLLLVIANFVTKRSSKKDE